MSLYLAIGSSQLGGFRQGFRVFNDQLADRFHFAGMWETGFGYLFLDSEGFVQAPDLVPHKGNPNKVNVKTRWKINSLERVPCIHDYQKIFILASPCKYFAPLYYPRNIKPSLFAPTLIRYCLESWETEYSSFDSINPWHFRISPLIKQLVINCPEKVVFIGAPLPIMNLEKQYFERLRSILESDYSLKEIHLENINVIRKLCDNFFQNPTTPDIILPHFDALCDLKITTLSVYANDNKNAWHANSEYWKGVVSHVVHRYYG